MMIRTTDRRRLSEAIVDGLSSGRGRNRSCWSLAALAAFRVLDSMLFATHEQFPSRLRPPDRESAGSEGAVTDAGVRPPDGH